ncbi:MAG: ribose-phosphate diphosphokinase [Gammaproteobacteria bacterium]
MILGFSEYDMQGKRLAKSLGLPYEAVRIHYFPDGESKVTLPPKLPDHVIFCRSLNQPNDKLIELILAAKTARQLGAGHLTLVAPYLCYMRQDKAFSPGEAISQTVIGQLLADLFDDVITVDPHLHRTHHLIDAVPASKALTLSATLPMREFLQKLGDIFLLGPDEESQQWLDAIAQDCCLSYCVARKKRLSDTEVQITLPEIDLQNKRVVLIDDVISSGETIAITGLSCFENGASSVDVLVTHPLFATGAIERLKQAGIGQIWSTDSITHSSNCIFLADLLAEGINKLN